MASHQRGGRGRAAGATTRVQQAAAVIAAVFVLVGILGFIPGITTNYGEMSFAGHYSEAKLLGLFQVSILHNLVHLLFGIVGLALARSIGGARIFLVGGGAIYLALWLYGLLIAHGDTLRTSVNFLPVNNADNWLHLGLGFGMVALGLALSPRAGSSGARLDRP